jgi:hypothetical protein
MRLDTTGMTLARDRGQENDGNVFIGSPRAVLID